MAEGHHYLEWLGTWPLLQDPALRMLRNVAVINQVLYGTDLPCLCRDLAANSKQRILQSSELNDSETGDLANARWM
jgi:predicted TIM-barrel fold metal-dependent hydrolase